MIPEMKTRCAFTLLAAKVVLGATLALGMVSTDIPVTTAVALHHCLAGDDNCDGIIDESETGWNCLKMGNFICGPGMAP